MREIIICDYDPEWPQRFEEEKLRLQDVVHSFHGDIEHIGSTSVPGLGAKPVIDIMIGIRPDHLLDAVVEPIKALGYTYGAIHETEMPYRRYFRRDTGGVRSHQIHVVHRDHWFWPKHLRFRDHLRDHPEDAKAYEVLKRQLAEHYRNDTIGYTDAKTEFIEGILRKAQ